MGEITGLLPLSLPASTSSTGGGGLACGNKVVIPGTLGDFLGLAAAQGDQVGDQLGFGLVGQESEKVGVVGLANIAIGGPKVAEPVLGVCGDEVLELYHPYHVVVLCRALREGSPSLSIPLELFPAILGGDLGDQPVRHVEHGGLVGSEHLHLTSVLVLEVRLMLLLTVVIKDDRAVVDRGLYRLVHIGLVLHAAARGHEGDNYGRKVHAVPGPNVAA